MSRNELAFRIRESEVEEMMRLMFELYFLLALSFFAAWGLWELAHTFWGKCYLACSLVSFIFFGYLCRKAE